MTIQTISSGVNSGDIHVYSGNELEVLSGGFVDATTVEGGGTEVVSSGGVTQQGTILSGGLLAGAGIMEGFNIDSGGSVSGLVLVSGGTLLQYGGHTSGVRLSGGTVILSSGAVASGDIVGDGGTEYVFGPGTVASGDMISSGGIEAVSSGAGAQGDIVSGDGELIIANAATKDDLVTRGGRLIFGGDILSGQDITLAASVTSKFIIGGVTLSSGAYLQLNAAFILSGATVSLTANAPISDLVVDAGAHLLGPGVVDGVQDDGSVSGVLVSAGELFVNSDGVASGIRVAAGGTEFVEGVTSGDTIFNDGIEYISLGMARGETISSGGALTIESGARGDSDVISTGGTETVSVGGVVSGEVVMGGGTLRLGAEVQSGQLITVGSSVASTTVLSGVTLASGADLQLDGAVIKSGGRVSLLTGSLIAAVNVESGGILSGPGTVLGDDGSNFGVASTDYGSVSGVVLGSGLLVVEQGGGANGVTIGSSGLEDVFGAATDDVNNGGAEFVELGGVSSDATILSDGREVVRGLASGTTVSQDGRLQISGDASGTRVESGGWETILAGGQAQATVLSAGYEYDYGSASATVILAGAREIVSGGVAASAVVRLGGIEDVRVRGIASAALVSSGGRLLVSSGGEASGARILAGGYEVVVRGGEADGTLLSAGYAYDYGSASGTVILSGAHEIVSGGATSGSVIRLGGTENVRSGGIARADIISSGGVERVASGGIAVATSVFSGGRLVVASGGSVSGGLIIHASQVRIDGTMAAGQTVSFAGTAGTLQLDNLAGFHAAISGFAGASDKIDLGDFAFAANETAAWSQTGTSGTLTVRDGAKTASLVLIGTYTTSDFTLSTNGVSGTLINDPTGANGLSAAARLTQAAASLEGGRGTAPFQGGGTALLDASPPVVTATSGR